MDIDDLIEDIKDSGSSEIKYIFDNLNITNEYTNDIKDVKIELTDDDILDDIKKLLIELVKVDNNFAKEVYNIIDRDDEPAPAGELVILAITTIALAPLCIILTMHVNQLRQENPDRDYTDCADILRALNLNNLYEKAFG